MTSPGNDESRPLPKEPTTAETALSSEVNTAALFLAEAMAITELDATVLRATDIGVYAVEAAARHYKVVALNGKVPAVRNPHPQGSYERAHCKGECGLQGHGVLDATDEVDTVAMWWSGQHRGRNIGVRIPDPMFLLDVDPRQGGDETLAKLVSEHAPLPETMQQLSGRGDGGAHYLYRRPPGKLSSVRLGSGLDIKTSSGYMVWAPSIHPATGKPYRRIDRPVAAPPAWLTDLVVQPVKFPTPHSSKSLRRSPITRLFTGRSIADEFCAAASWSHILEPYGWTCSDTDPDADGARWLHPTHTSSCSATIRYGCLFVYSTNTEFETTESGAPNGYTKFRAFAVLEHHGDLSLAARALSGHGVA